MSDVSESLPFIGGDKFGETDHRLSQASELEMLWPRPNWQNEIRKGMRVDVAAMIEMVRAGLRQEPKSNTAWDISDASWGVAYAQAIPIIRDLLMTSLTVFEVSSLNSRLAAALGTSVSKIGRSPPLDNITFWAAGRGIFRLISPGSMSLQQQVLGKWLPKLGWPRNESPLLSSIVPLALADGGWRVVKVEGNRYRLAIANTFENEAQALSVAIGISNRHVSFLEGSRNHTVTQGLPRYGPAYRPTRLITIDAIHSEFGFRAAEFARSVGANERQDWLNGVFDAFADLSDVLAMPRHWIGLGGVLLAIGSRPDSGNVDPFDLPTNSMHLTKSYGAGTLAYKWWLAADSRLNENTIKCGRYLSGSAVSRSLLEDLSPRSTQIVEQIREIHQYIIPASDFHMAARKINRIGSFGYGWDRPERLFGRAFEAYVQDKLLEKGRISPWLVHGTLESDYDISSGLNGFYPQGYERTNLNILFDLLMKILTTSD
jgi:hypothetical protein